MDIPDRVAEAQKIIVSEGKLKPHVNGLWVPERRTVLLRWGMDHVTRRCTLAHELGHAHHGHVRTHDDRYDARAEREADRYAADMLINPVEYALAEEMYGCTVAGLAYHLDVVPRFIEIWRSARRGG